MNEKLPPPSLASLTSTQQHAIEPPLTLPPIDTEGTSAYHITAAQVPMEFGGTLKSSKGSGSKNNSNQQSPQKKSRGSSGGVNAGSHTSNPNGSYCTCFGGCGYGHRNRISMPFWPAVLANLGICALLAGYIFIGSFIFLTIENSNELRGVGAGNLDVSGLVQQTSAAQLPEIIQSQQEQQQLLDQEQQLHQLHYTSQKQQDNSSLLYPYALSTHRRNERSPKDDDSTRNRRRRSRRHLAESDATSSAPPTPEVSTHINGMHDDDDNNSNIIGNADVGGNAHAVITKQRQSIVERGSSAAIVVAGAKHSTHDHVNDNDDDDDDDGDERSRRQTLPLAGGFGAIGVDEDYVGDDAGAANSLEDVERRRTVENIWDITVSLNILYKENWTRLAALEIAKFQDQLVKRLVMDLTLSTANGATQSTAASSGHGWNGKPEQTGYGIYERQRFWHSENTQQQQNNQRQHHRWHSNQRTRGQRSHLKSEQFEWNFATAFLYSTTVITTVGYGTITARTTLGRMVTIGYATLGIPLTLIYLSSVGSVLAKILRYCCSTRTSAAQRKGICCFCCLRRQPAQRQQQPENIIGSSSIFNRHPQVADRKTELKLKHFQQPQQQQPLPYCYVRPPAALVTAQEMEMQQHTSISTAIGGNGNGSGSGSGIAGGNTFDNLSVATSAAENQSRQQQQQQQQQHAATTASAAVLSWSIAAPAALCLLLLLAYVAFGAIVIALLEDWPLIDGIYFCFMSLSTIGFCDLLPGLGHGADVYYNRQSSSTTATTNATTATTNLAVWFCAVYILSGLTLTSMCVNLLHDEIASRMRVVVKFEKVHELQQEQHESGYYSTRS